MPKAKFRRTILAAGGLEFSSGTTVSSSATQNFANALSASKTASFNGAIRVGTAGTSFQNIFGGTANGSTPSLTANTLGTGSIVIANANVGDLVFLTPGSLPPTVNVVSACVTAASVVTASFYNAGSATQSQAVITWQYLLIRAS